MYMDTQIEERLLQVLVASLNPAMLSGSDVQNTRISKVSVSFSNKIHSVFLKLQNETLSYILKKVLNSKYHRVNSAQYEVKLLDGHHLL